jgi:uncharacterized protein YggE
MQRSWIDTRSLLVALVAVAGLAAVGAITVTRTAAAQAGLPAASPSTITVVGEGEARGTPDVAYVTVGVQTRGGSAIEASEENSRRMSAVLETLRARGIAPQDIRTSGLSVNLEYQPMPPVPAGPRMPSAAVPGPGRTEPAAYQASNTVTVTVQQVAQAGALLDAALAASANQIGGLHFGIKDPTALRQQAIEQATDAARTKAEQLGAKLGLRLVGISSVVEESGAFPPGPEMLAARSFSGGAAPPIEGGELRVTARVRVAYQFQ